MCRVEGLRQTGQCQDMRLGREKVQVLELLLRFVGAVHESLFSY